MILIRSVMYKNIFWAFCHLPVENIFRYVSINHIYYLKVLCICATNQCLLFHEKSVQFRYGVEEMDSFIKSSRLRWKWQLSTFNTLVSRLLHGHFTITDKYRNLFFASRVLQRLYNLRFSIRDTQGNCQRLSTCMRISFDGHQYL